MCPKLQGVMVSFQRGQARHGESCSWGAKVTQSCVLWRKGGGSGWLCSPLCQPCLPAGDKAVSCVLATCRRGARGHSGSKDRPLTCRVRTGRLCLHFQAFSCPVLPLRKQKAQGNSRLSQKESQNTFGQLTSGSHFLYVECVMPQAHQARSWPLPPPKPSSLGTTWLARHPPAVTVQTAPLSEAHLPRPRESSDPPGPLPAACTALLASHAAF